MPRARGLRLIKAWYRIGSSSSATTLGRRVRISERIDRPMSNTCPTPRRVIIQATQRRAMLNSFPGLKERECS